MARCLCCHVAFTFIAWESWNSWGWRGFIYFGGKTLSWRWFPGVFVPFASWTEIKGCLRSGPVLSVRSLCLFALWHSPVCVLPVLAHDRHLKGAFSSCLLLSGELVKLAKRCLSVPLLDTVCENQNQIRKCAVQAMSRARKFLFKHSLKAISSGRLMLTWAGPCCKVELCPSHRSEHSHLLLPWADTGTHLFPGWN